MKFSTSLFCLFVVVSLLVSCKTYVGESLLKVRKGLTVAEIYTLDSNIENDSALVISVDGLPSKSVYQLVISRFPSYSGDNYLIYAFRDNQLFYWGYPYQFRRSKVVEIRAFGDAATSYMVERTMLEAKVNSFFND